MSIRSLPPLPAIRCFEAAARLGGFSAAARELNLTQAAVSYQIQSLEDRVGGPLFVRHARGVALTDRGQHLAPLVSEAFAVLRRAFANLDQKIDHILRINSVTTFATNWLVMRIGGFQLAHPELAVRLEASDRMIDLEADEIDIAIRSGRGQWPNLNAHRLFEVAFTPVLAPALLQTLGPLQHPRDLLRAPLIDPDDPWWQAWFKAAGVAVDQIGRPNDLRVPTQQLAGSAALAGHGVAIVTRTFFAEELATGRLVQPFPLVHSEGSSYWLAYPSRHQRQQRIIAFRDWILSVVQKEHERRPSG